MNKYVVFRLPYKKSAIKQKAELIAVEYGDDISDAAPALIKSATVDLEALPESNGRNAQVDAPFELPPSYRYQYEMHGVLIPPSIRKKVIFINYVVKEEEA